MLAEMISSNFKFLPPSLPAVLIHWFVDCLIRIRSGSFAQSLNRSFTRFDLGADKIAVVNEGIIAELGNHTELLAKNGLYADLVRLQMTGDEDESSKSSDNLAALVEETQQLVEAVAATATAEVTGSTSGEVVKAADKEAEEEISKDESARLTKRVWDLVLQHKLWFFAALFGGAAFGSVFPGECDKSWRTTSLCAFCALFTILEAHI